MKEKKRKEKKRKEKKKKKEKKRKEKKRKKKKKTKGSDRKPLSGWPGMTTKTPTNDLANAKRGPSVLIWVPLISSCLGISSDKRMAAEIIAYDFIFG